MKIAILPGDDIGPEITEAALRVLRRADNLFGLNCDLEEFEVGMAAHRRTGTTLPTKALEAAIAADGVILGPGGMTAYPPAKDGGINIPGTIRKRLDLYANIRPARSRPGIPHALPSLNCVIARENTEGFYADRNLFHGYGEVMPTPEVAISMRLITSRASRRIGRVAAELARRRNKHITMVGKRHVLQVTDGLFMQEVRSVLQQYEDVTLHEIDVDAMAADIYTNPAIYDVILTTNMFGDILSNLTAALSGGLGLAAALNVGDEHAAANAGHGSAPNIAGKGIANPTGMILSTALLLDWLGSRHKKNNYVAAAQAIQTAVDKTLGTSNFRTLDLGGTLSTNDFAATISSSLI
jgi:isocitrate/isopropylmalate dehydrogenase